ncbi:MBL fold metallo-hydrolase [Aneurinibacillus terranovensis]|uniref:MBL fold metallo-hydrolase n=1 Tax=Aneurinibacillus terranovensis TaxID=278991 RepID=UPI0003F5C4CD|nr:MBL fold metallo-hydrolase [Aneurinibacillus terranovensis]
MEANVQTHLKPMTSEEVTQIVKNKEPLFILDVRNQREFEDWKIEGKSIEITNIPYFDLLDGVDLALERISQDKQLLVVCAKEGSSKFVAQQIVEAGKSNVYYLQGGMKAWSDHLHQVKVYEDSKMKVYQFIRVGKGCLSYMIISGKEALVVDPARMIDAYQQVAQQEGVTITHVVDSHLHADHISGGKKLADQTGAKYYLMKSEGAVFEHEPFEEHEQIVFEQVHLQVVALKTPGHTPGSVSFFVNEKLLFSGDTIFVGGLGRPDLGGKVREWAKDLYETVYGKVANIADEVIVFPAHYADFNKEMSQGGYIGATLGEIRKNNEMMHNKQEQDFIEAMVQSANAETPPNFEEIVAINKGIQEAVDERQQELEIGPNRCAIHHTA